MITVLAYKAKSIQTLTFFWSLLFIYFFFLLSWHVCLFSLLIAGYNNLEVAEYLLEHGADVNAQDKGGLIPLHNAASYGVSMLKFKSRNFAAIYCFIKCILYMK